MRVDRATVLELLASGRLVALPTESSFALAGRIDRPTALAELADIKAGRGEPVGLMLDHPRNLPGWVRDIPPVALDLTRAYWPGALTLVFVATANVPEQVQAGTGSVGFRVPRHEALRALLAEVGVPLTATSANRPGALPACSIAAVEAALGADFPVWDLEENTAGGLPSTVVDIRDGGWRVLRPGAVQI